jgi:hypothetical protein
MKLPSFLSQYTDRNSPTRLFQGLAAGIVGTLIIGFGYSEWVTGGTETKNLAAAKVTTMISALAPICADNFQRAAKADKGIIAKLAAVDSWRRDGHLINAGYVTFPGGAQPNTNVADECAALLNEALKFK